MFDRFMNTPLQLGQIYGVYRRVQGEININEKLIWLLLMPSPGEMCRYYFYL